MDILMHGSLFGEAGAPLLTEPRDEPAPLLPAALASPDYHPSAGSPAVPLGMEPLPLPSGYAAEEDRLRLDLALELDLDLDVAWPPASPSTTISDGASVTTDPEQAAVLIPDPVAAPWPWELPEAPQVPEQPAAKRAAPLPEQPAAKRARRDRALAAAQPAAAQPAPKLPESRKVSFKSCVRVASAAFSRLAVPPPQRAEPVAPPRAEVSLEPVGAAAAGAAGGVVYVTPDGDTRERFFPGGERQLYTIKHHGVEDYDFELRFALSRDVTPHEFAQLGLGGRLAKPGAGGRLETVVYQHRNGSAAAGVRAAAAAAAREAAADPASAPKAKKARQLAARLARSNVASAAVLAVMTPAQAVSGFVLRFMSSRNGVHVKAAKDSFFELTSAAGPLFVSNKLSKVRALRPEAR